MKRSGFKLKPRKPLKRTPFRRKSAPKTPKIASGRTKLPKVSTMRNKCDALLTPIIKLMYPYCLLTGEPTEVAHHHVHKGQSNALRYYLPNLVPLTHRAHQALHNNESYYASKIVQLRGIDWFQDLEEHKKAYVKTDVHWYIEHHERLSTLLRELQQTH